VHAKIAEVADVSDVTLLNRLRQSENWLRQLCQQLWKDNGVVLEPALRKTGAAGGRHRCARAGQDRKSVADSL